MKKLTILSCLLAIGVSGVFADDIYDDDIYYNPKKQTASSRGKKNSNYIANMADMDVDEYNRRGQYYVTPIDTIGYGVENGEDFVYTRQIQKYYNPTIVVENADVLQDILDNSYGNVNVVYNYSGIPTFMPVYNYAWNWPYYYPRYGWSIGAGWGGWNWSFGWSDPWWGPSWAWGPAWGPSWNWGWGPAWGPGWGPGPGWNRPGYVAHHWRPAGNRPYRPNGGWAATTRPGGNRYTGGYHRVPGAGVSSSGSQRPGSSNVNPYNNRNYHRGSNVNPGKVEVPGNNVPATARPSGNSRPVNSSGYQLNSNGHRVQNGNSTVSRPATPNRERTNSTVNRSNNTTNRSNSTVNRSTTNRSNGNYHRSSGGNSRNSGGSYRGGGSRGGGGHRR